jgi:hypothetical protein
VAAQTSPQSEEGALVLALDNSWNRALETNDTKALDLLLAGTWKCVASALRNSRGWIVLRIVKRVDFFQFTVADVHAVEDLIHPKDCLHFKDCCDKISLDNMLLDVDTFDGWQNTRQESDHSVPPDQLSYAWPLKGDIRGEWYFGYILARQTSQIRLDNCDFFLS